MARTFIVTGSASGIGLTVCEMLRAQGGRVIGIDIHDADINADLSTREGRQEAVSKAIEISNGDIDVLIANAGLALPISKTVSVNFFGVTDLVMGLIATLKKSKATRVVVTSYMASLMPNDKELANKIRGPDGAIPGYLPGLLG